MKRIFILLTMILTLTACAGMERIAQELTQQKTANKVNPLRADKDSILFRHVSDKGANMDKKGNRTSGLTWDFYVVNDYAANGTIFYSNHNQKTAYNPLDAFGRGYTPENRVYGIYIWNPRVNLVVRVPNDNRKGHGYRRTASGKNIYDQLQFYRPVGKTKQFLELLSTNQNELRGYFSFADTMTYYRNILKNRPLDKKPIVDKMNSYFAEHKDKACKISAKLKAADTDGVYVEDDGFSEKYCVIGERVLQGKLEYLAERRGGYQQAYNGLDPQSNSPEKALGYKKVSLWEDAEIMKKLPVSYDGPEELWLIDTPSNFLTAFSKLGAEPEISKPTTESQTLNIAAPEIELVHIKGGCFEISSTSFNIHEVCVNDFYMGKYEVTQGQWKAIMGDNPSNFKDCGDNCPVENVNWFDAQNFINKLNQKTGKKYRLPTEAEWKYSAYKSGRNEREGWSGTNNQSELGDYAWWNKNAEGTTHPVGQKKPNKIGLYDMSGNVSEWVFDWYALDYENTENRGKIKDGKYDLGVDYNKDSLRNNPKGPQSGKARVICGSSWKAPTVWNFKINLRNSEATDSYPLLPMLRFNDNGFRLLLPVEK